jgi:hypothetical protein
MEIGDKIIWVGDMTGREAIREGVVSKLRSSSTGNLVWVDGLHKPEDCIYEAYCWPARVRDELAAILARRLELQKQVDDSMKLVYQLRNAITRGEK